MAIGFTQKTYSGAYSASNPWTTASVTCTVGHSVIIAVGCRLIGEAPTSITGSSITGATKIVHQSWDQGVLTVWRAIATGSAGALTINWTAIRSGWAEVTEITGGPTRIVQNNSASGLAGNDTVTLTNALRGGSASLYYASWNSDTDNATPRTSWTEMNDADGGTERAYSQYIVAGDQTGSTSAHASEPWACGMLEIATLSDALPNLNVPRQLSTLRR